jgi:hypothetical protein
MRTSSSGLASEGNNDMLVGLRDSGTATLGHVSDTTHRFDVVSLPSCYSVMNGISAVQLASIARMRVT